MTTKWVPIPCLRLAGAGYDMQGFGLGQAAEVLYKHINRAKKEFFLAANSIKSKALAAISGFSL
jgi:hypothetical protein